MVGVFMRSYAILLELPILWYLGMKKPTDARWWARMVGIFWGY
jgi:hypothetical protein